MAPAAWEADILPRCIRKATRQRISRAWARRPKVTGLRNVLMRGRASGKIMAQGLRRDAGVSGLLDTAIITKPAEPSEPSSLEKAQLQKLRSRAASASFH